MRPPRFTSLIVLLWLVAQPVPSLRAQEATFQGLGDLSGGLFQSKALGVSGDGNVVVGEATNSNGGVAFRWTAAGGIVSLGALPGGSGLSVARAASADGSVVVGASSGGSGTEAFRWTAAGGMQGLGDLPTGAFFSQGFGVSADGSVVTGYAAIAGAFGGNNEAFRWTSSGGMQGIGTLAGGDFSLGLGISADGAVIVGNSESGSSSGEAFRWTSGGGMVGLGFLPGGESSIAFAASGDGSTIVGASAGATAEEAFRWTSAGMIPLGLAGSTGTSALAVSGDGTVVVGRINDFPLNRAFIWRAATGMENLRDVLVQQGVDMTGWTLIEATSISANGRVIVGFGVNPQGQMEAFRATLSGGHRWIDPTGGSWDVASNWQPATVPGADDDVTFDLDATYTVFGGPGFGGRTARRLAADDGTVDYNLDNLTLTATTFINPSLSVSFGATAKVISGASSVVDAVVGYRTDATAVSRLQVFNAGTTLSVSGNLVIGLEGRGEAFVAAGSLNTFSTSLGGDPALTGLETGTGELIVGNDGALNTDVLYVGNDAAGTLRVEAGGAATCRIGYVGGDAESTTGLIEVTGFEPEVSRFFATDTLYVGDGGPGTLRLREAGQVTAGTVIVGVNADPAARVDLDGALSTLIASAIVVGTGGAENASISIARGGIVETNRLVVGATGSFGIASVGPKDATGTAPPILSVEQAGFTGECLVGGPGSSLGWLQVSGGGLVFCDQVSVPAAGGNGLLEVDGAGSEPSKVTVSRVLAVGVSGGGDVDLRGGVIDAVNAASAPPADPDDVVVGSQGRILGAGTVIGRVRSSGTIAPGVQVVTPSVASRLPAESTAGGAAGGTLQVSGAIEFESSSTLEVALAGPDTTQQGRLRVLPAHAMDGSAALAGALRLAFQDGYAPLTGDTFVLLDATSITGAFSSTEVTGLEPGWLFEIVVQNGTVVLNSQSNGVPTTPAEPAPPTASRVLLHPPVPNPVMASATLRFDLPHAGDVRMALYDALGREVAVLVQGVRPAGRHEATLDTGPLARGVYVARLTTGSATQVRLLTVAR